MHVCWDSNTAQLCAALSSVETVVKKFSQYKINLHGSAAVLSSHPGADTLRYAI